MNDLVTLTTDGAHRAAPIGPEDGTDPILPALVQLHRQLGAAPEGRIGSRMPLPTALGTGPVDQMLPQTLSQLADATGDLTPGGWRLGPGTDHAWRRAREHRERVLDAARIALLGHDGPLSLAVLGPATLGAAVLLPTGQRLLADTGALRDLPAMLAEGLLAQLDLLQERVPGAQPHVLLREDHVDAVHRGTVRTPAGRGRYPARRAHEIGADWSVVLHALHQRAEATVECGMDLDLLRAARDAGARRIALTPAQLPGLDTARGRLLWEAIAQAHDDGIGLELILDPCAAAQEDLDRVMALLRELGLAARELAGLTLLARADARRAPRRDPALEPPRTALLDTAAVDRLLHLGPAWAERVSD